MLYTLVGRRLATDATPRFNIFRIFFAIYGIKEVFAMDLGLRNNVFMNDKRENTNVSNVY